MSRIDEKLEAIRQRQDNLREQWQQLKDEKIELSKAIWEDEGKTPQEKWQTCKELGLPQSGTNNTDYLAYQDILQLIMMSFEYGDAQKALDLFVGVYDGEIEDVVGCIKTKKHSKSILNSIGYSFTDNPLYSKYFTKPSPYRKSCLTDFGIIYTMMNYVATIKSNYQKVVEFDELSFSVSELSERLERKESVNRILIEDKLLTISNTADKIQLCKSGGLDQRETSELTGLSLSTVKRYWRIEDG